MTDRKAAAALDAALGAVFRTLEGRGVPQHILATVDQLDSAAGDRPDAAAMAPPPGSADAEANRPAGARPD
jgi:hypothetical protein